MKQLVNYVDMEGKYPPWTSEGKAFWLGQQQKNTLGFSWFPNPLNECVKGMSDRNVTNCMTMIQLPTYPLAKVQNTEFYPYDTSLDQLLSGYSCLNKKTVINRFKEIEGIQKSAFTNPGIPFSLIYGAWAPSKQSVYYNFDVRKNWETQQFSTPTGTSTQFGDGTIPAWSSMAPLFKWSYEFDTKVPNAKPIRLVEYCSSYNTGGTPYDSTPFDSEWTFTKNEYYGIPCDCIEDPSVGCLHSNLIQDTHVIGYVAQMLINNDKQDFSKTLGSKLSETTLEAIASQCPQLTADWTIQTVEGLLNTLKA